MQQNRSNHNTDYIRFNKSLKGLLFFLFLCIFFFKNSTSFSQTSQSAGPWSTPSTWVGNVVPTAGQSVIINHNVSLDYSTPIYNNITVNAGVTLNIVNTATSSLNFSGNISIAGVVNNQGGILQTTASGRTFTLSGSGQYIHTPRNNTALDESIFSRCTETFSTTSTVTINKWFDLSIPLGDPTRVTGNFGNIIMNLPDTISWEQDGLFMSGCASQRVFGTLTVSSGTVSMDNGTGACGLQIFNNVNITTTGRIIFASGPNRVLNLNTGAFSDNSTAVNPTIIMDNCFGVTNWVANGNVNISHNFYGILGSGMSPFGDLRITVNGQLNLTGGSINFISGAVAPLQLTVNGNTTISGSPTMVRFIDGNSGNLTFVTNFFTISGGGANTLMGGNFLLNHATGIPSIRINNDFTINGASNTYILDAPNSTQKIRLDIGGSLIMSGVNSNLTVARHKGAMTVATGGNITQTNGKFIGQIDTLSTGLDSVVVAGTFLMNVTSISDYFRINYGLGNTVMRTTGAFTIQNSGIGQGIGFTGIYNGTGNMTFNALGNFTLTAGRFTGIFVNKPTVDNGSLTFTTGVNFAMAAGYFRGIDNRSVTNDGNITFTTGNMNYTGGNFSGYYAVHEVANQASFTFNGLLQITFNTAATDSFSFIGITEVNSVVSNLKLSVSVLGNFNITGANGSFISSLARGKETINITGSMNISGGKNSFNSYPASNLNNAHPVVINIGSDLSVNGGSMYFSANNDTMTAQVTGNFSMTNGEFITQAGNMPATLNINGGYNQSAGTFFLHKNSTEISFNPISVDINADNNLTGDFVQSGGIINFDNNTNSTQTFLTINSPNVTYSGTGSMTMANPGTNPVSGIIFYGRTGNINFSRLLNTHSIQQVEQHIVSGCTLTVISGNLQVASINVTPYYNSLIVNSDAVLDLQGNQLFSNSLQAYSGFRVSGRVRTTRTQGFYDGTVLAAINSVGNITYLLLSNSVVEYYGSDTQVITGIGVGNALAVPQKYYNLEINFTGTPNSEFVYPTNIPDATSVFVRNKLILTNGELNLDNDHNPLTGGRSIVIERDSLTALTYTNGYIRSEVYDSTASLIWKINSRVGMRTIPFRYDSANPIPFKFNLTSGSADTLTVSTYHTPAADNLPYPPGVPHVNGLTGANNSAQTVDRFWFIRTTGASPVANMEFVVIPAEMTGITNPRAQAWIPSGVPGWQYPYQGAQASITNGTSMAGATYFPNNWWTLSGLSSPLPVTLVDFTGECKNDKTELRWSTASEINNDYFTVQSSTDGVIYESIGVVNGNGNTTSINNYTFKIPGSVDRITYYKLVQTDFDGTPTEYGPVMISPCKSVSALEVSVITTNPDELSVIIKNPVEGKYNVTLFSLDGKPLISKSVYLESGINIVPLYTGNLATAIYIVRTDNMKEAVTKKVAVGFSR